MLRRFIGFTIVILAGASCSRGDSASAHPRDDPHTSNGGVAPRPAVVAVPGQPYKVIGVTTSGTLNGTVDFDGVFPADSVVRPSSDQAVCGNALTLKRVAHSGTRVAGALVWLTDIRTGKSFPIQRRFELTDADCALDPYVQVVLTNSTLNVSNEDRGIHTNRFINVGTGDIAAVAPFNDDGEVVPVDKFREPAEVEIVCQQHPWEHAWLAVLDHPYYAMSSPAGAFSIDAIPPGKYHVRAWHPALGYADDSVTIAPGQQANIAFRIRPTAPGARVAPTAAPANPPAADTARSTAPAASSTPAASTTQSTASSTPGGAPAQPPPRQRL
jgi:hypothetical protein